MKNADANVSRCANPQCEQEFKRLGEGKLFVRPVREERQRSDPEGALVMSGVCASNSICVMTGASRNTIWSATDGWHRPGYSIPSIARCRTVC